MKRVPLIMLLIAGSGSVYYLINTNADNIVIRIISIVLGCIMVSAIHEMGHCLAAFITKIPVYDVGIELYGFIPRGYTKVNLEKASKTSIIAFFAGGSICTLFLFFITLVFNSYHFIQLIALFSTVINIIPLYKNDGYYILRECLRLLEHNK